MANKCPNCGSYNTEVSIVNYAGRGLAHTFRLAAAGLVAMPASLFGQTAAHAAFHNVWEGTKIKEEFKGHHCNNCGEDF